MIVRSSSNTWQRVNEEGGVQIPIIRAEPMAEHRAKNKVVTLTVIDPDIEDAEAELSPEIETEIERRVALAIENYVEHEIERRIEQIEEQLNEKFNEAVQRRIEQIEEERS